LDNIQVKKLLVPLDGSPLAESVLPATARLARKTKAAVTFFHVIERDAPNTVHGQLHLTKPDQAESYLRVISSMPIFEGMDVEVHVHETGVRDVSQSISDHSEELSADLIIMCTHGRSKRPGVFSSGLRGLLVGSIAQQVISLSDTPVMLVNPSVEESRTRSSFENFLIPLDGNPDHEHALGFATSLAKMCGAKVHLLIAVPRFGTMSGDLTVTNRYLPGTTTRMMDMIVPDAKDYLNKVQSRAELDGLSVTTSTSRSSPAKAISRTAKSVKADLVVLATHGKRGSEPFWEGSVTPKVIRSERVPVLLVPVRE